MSDKVSQGAMELAHKWNGDPQGEGYRYRLAYLIDQELREVILYLQHTDLCDMFEDGFISGRPCTCGLSALLAKWTVRG